MQNVVLVRATTGERLHSEVPVHPGDDTGKVSAPAAINFSVPSEWETKLAHDGSRMIEKGKTLVVVEAANRSIARVGLVDAVDPQANQLVVRAGGFSMTAGMSGPWEGHQGYYVSMDPVALFRRVWAQVQSYPNAIHGIRVTGDGSSGSTVGYPGSARWQAANRDYQRYKPQLNTWEGRLLTRERTLAQRKEAMFKAAGLKRVGDVIETDDGTKPPDDPGWKADSTLWIRKDQGELGRWGRAYRWRNGRWVSQSQADRAVRGYRGYVSTMEAAKDEVDRLKYLMDPAKELLEKYEREAREEYGLYFWQNHNLGDVIEELMALGPFEYRERAAWVQDPDGNDRLDLMIEVGAPRVGVRREELHLEFGVNLQGDVSREYGPTYTGVAQFGAGTGSEVLSEQRDWDPKHVVRNIMVDTDKDAYTRALTRSAANKLRARARGEAGLKFTNLTVHHDRACPVGSFEEGDTVRITGHLDGGITVDQLVRVMEAKSIWGKDQTEIEVVNV